MLGSAWAAHASHQTCSIESIVCVPGIWLKPIEPKPYIASARITYTAQHISPGHIRSTMAGRSESWVGTATSSSSTAIGYAFARIKIFPNLFLLLAPDNEG